MRLIGQAGWHGSLENAWQFTRDNWLSNRIFGFSADIGDYCCCA